MEAFQSLSLDCQSETNMLQAVREQSVDYCVFFFYEGCTAHLFTEATVPISLPWMAQIHLGLAPVSGRVAYRTSQLMILLHLTSL